MQHPLGRPTEIRPEAMKKLKEIRDSLVVLLTVDISIASQLLLLPPSKQDLEDILLLRAMEAKPARAATSGKCTPMARATLALSQALHKVTKD